MTVDRGDQRLGPAIERAEALVERVDQAALAQAIEAGHRLEIETGREGRPVGRDHGSARTAVGGEALEQRRQLFEQAGIHGVHGRMGQGHERDTLVGEGEFQGCHGRKVDPKGP